MKVLLLAGGLGTRISEETHLVPKPMIEIGGKPILWHIMKIYSSYGYNDFVVCLGYKGYVIKEYFANYFLHMSDITFDMTSNVMNVHQKRAEPWTVTMVDTGENSMTGGRLLRVADHIKDEEAFCLTYGDGVADVNIKETVDFHKEHGKKITMTAIQPEGRFGALGIDNDQTIHSFLEKPKGDGAWINGGYFVCEPSVIEYIAGDETIFEREPLENLAKEGELKAYKHFGFWQCMDTLRDKNKLEELWQSGTPPWKNWK